MKRDSIAWFHANTVKLRKQWFGSGKRCLGEWIRSINKVLRVDSFWGRVRGKFEYIN